MQILSIVLLFALVRTADDYVMYALVTTIASAGGNIERILCSSICALKSHKKIEPETAY